LNYGRLLVELEASAVKDCNFKADLFFTNFMAITDAFVGFLPAFNSFGLLFDSSEIQSFFYFY